MPSIFEPIRRNGGVFVSLIARNMPSWRTHSIAHHGIIAAIREAWARNRPRARRPFGDGFRGGVSEPICFLHVHVGGHHYKAALSSVGIIKIRYCRHQARARMGVSKQAVYAVRASSKPCWARAWRGGIAIGRSYRRSASEIRLAPAPMRSRFSSCWATVCRDAETSWRQSGAFSRRTALVALEAGILKSLAMVLASSQLAL